MSAPSAPDADDVAPPPGLALVRLLAPLVPGDERDEWRQEWHAELAWAWDHAREIGEQGVATRLRLLARAAGAVADALYLRRRAWSLEMLGSDLRHALRAIARRPGFATVVVLTLALGIGANAAVFSVVHGVLLRPLPFPEPERVVSVLGEPTDGDVEKVGPGQSWPDYLDLRAQSTAFSHLAALRSAPATLTAPGLEPARVRTTLATSDLWPMLGVRALLGRTLGAADERPDAPAVAVLSHALWRGRFGGDPGVIGRTISLDGQPVTVVGVMRPDLRLTNDTELWRPLRPDPTDLARGAHRLAVVGRLAPAVPLARAQAEASAVFARLAQMHPESNTNRGARVQPLQETIVGDTRPALLVLLGAVALVLLVGCANLASLFLARAAAREREMAVRAALGARRARLTRLWVTESLVLTLAGGAAGLLVAWAGMRALLALAPRTIPRADEVALSLPVLLFLLAASVLTGLFFGVLPAVQRRREEPSLAALRDGGRGSTAGAHRRRLRLGLVLAEVAMATVLVTGAGMLLRGFATIVRTDPGFDPDGLVVAPLQLPLPKYADPARVSAFYERLERELATIPGVRSVAIAYEHPLGEGWTSSYRIAGREPPPAGSEPEARVRPVRPGYFRTVGVPLLAGRDVAPTDHLGAPGAVVVNEAFVRRHFAGRHAIGERIERAPWWPGQPESFEIVGVVADERFLGLDAPAEPATYFAHDQFPMSDMWIVLRADGDPAALAPLIRERVWRLDASLPVEQVRTMRELIGQSVAEPRFLTYLLGTFAAVALLLAAVGIFGVLSYTVSQRTGEIGVRLALGADRGRVVRQVVGEGLGVALAGVAVGALLTLLLAPVARRLPFPVPPGDPLLYAAVALLLTLVATAAAWLPARRASRVDPVVALRGEG